MLYPIPGNPKTARVPGEVEDEDAAASAEGQPLIRKLLDPSNSIIQKFDCWMWSCLHGWRGHPNRRPWMILEVLHADLGSQKFKRFARGTILRLDAASQRRISAKFFDWPYRLYMACLPEAPRADTQAVMQRVLDEDGTGRAKVKLINRGTAPKRSTEIGNMKSIFGTFSKLDIFSRCVGAPGGVPPLFTAHCFRPSSRGPGDVGFLHSLHAARMPQS